MILLDTNVVSEAMRVHGDPAVRHWLERQRTESLYLAAPSYAELLFGIECMPDGRKRSDLEERLRLVIRRRLPGRIIAFDHHAAEAYALLSSAARRRGQVIDLADGQIAAIARVNGFSVATRDIGPFAAANLPVINPWVTLT